MYRKENLPALPMVSIDRGICIENMWLETDALDMGGVCIGVSPIQKWTNQIHQILELPESVVVFSLFALGHPDENEHKQDRFDLKRIHFVE